MGSKHDSYKKNNTLIISHSCRCIFPDSVSVRNCQLTSTSRSKTNQSISCIYGKCIYITTWMSPGKCILGRIWIRLMMCRKRSRPLLSSRLNLTGSGK